MTDAKGVKGEESIEIAAPPDKVWAMVADVTRMGEWSPENKGGEWIDGASAPAVGARFKGRNKQGRARWSTKCLVEECEPGRIFAFATQVGGKDRTRWSYRFEPVVAGTRVTESWESVRYGRLSRLLLKPEKRQPEIERGVRQTLERLKEKAEAS